MKQTFLVLLLCLVTLSGCAGKSRMDETYPVDTEPETIKEVKKTEGYISSEYSNKSIGIYFQYPSDWNVFDDQEAIKDSIYREETDYVSKLWMLLITPSNNIPDIHELEKLNFPEIMFNFIDVGTEFTEDDLKWYINYHISIIKKADSDFSMLSGIRTVVINGKKLTTFSASMPTENIFIKKYFYIDDNKHRLVEILVGCKLSRIKEYKHFFDETIGSIKFIEN